MGAEPMGLTRTLRWMLLIAGFAVALAAIALGVYSLWNNEDSIKSVWSGVDKPDLGKFAEEAEKVVTSIQEKANLSDAGPKLESLKEKLSQFGEDAGPGLKDKLDRMRRSLESAAESLRRRAQDFPQRLAEVAEAAKHLREKGDGAGDSED